MMNIFTIFYYGLALICFLFLFLCIKKFVKELLGVTWQKIILVIAAGLLFACVIYLLISMGYVLSLIYVKGWWKFYETNFRMFILVALYGVAAINFLTAFGLAKIMGKRFWKWTSPESFSYVALSWTIILFLIMNPMVYDAVYMIQKSF